MSKVQAENQLCIKLHSQSQSRRDKNDRRKNPASTASVLQEAHANRFPASKSLHFPLLNLILFPWINGDTTLLYKLLGNVLMLNLWSALPSVHIIGVYVCVCTCIFVCIETGGYLDFFGRGCAARTLNP